METLRVVQLDANTLQSELGNISRDAWQQALSSLPPRVQSFLDRFSPDVHFLIDSVYWSTILTKNSTVGQSFMDISYSPLLSNGKKFGHFIFSVLLPYLTQRLSSFVDERSPMIRFIQKLRLFTEMISILHFIHFLRKGGPSTLIENTLGMRTQYGRPPSIGAVNMEEQNRELLWNLFRDALLLASPIIAILYRVYEKRIGRGLMNDRMEGDEIGCTVCGSQRAIVPVRVTPCSCIACYWCMQSAADNCAVCEKRVDGREILRGKEMGK